MSRNQKYINSVVTRYWYDHESYFAKVITEEVKKMLAKISKREEEEFTKRTREREQLAEAKRNSLSGNAKKLIKSVVPKGVLVLLLAMLVDPYVLCFIC
ncbi:unnamed protein product, partial [Thlaspi arvense]